MKLEVYADRLSQPSRAIIIFCKINGIEFDEIEIDVAKGKQRSPEYIEINPMKNVPAIVVDGTFKLFESHAMLAFLARAYPGVADHWYPEDLFKRAKIDSVLHWHHANLRRGSVGVVLNSRFALALGIPSNLEAAAKAEITLSDSLAKIESIWLDGKSQFLVGCSQPSIADLSLVCEIMQLEFLDEKDRDRILSPHKKVLQWVEDTKNATRPIFDEIHGKLFMVKEKVAKLFADGATDSEKYQSPIAEETICSF